MPTSVVTCADVEARDLEAAYIAGRLPEDEAAAYELHYFACERCWAALQSATQVRAAFATSPQLGRRRIPWGLAAAAAVVLLAGGGMVAYLGRAPTPVITLRGSADTLVITPSRSGTALAASWRPAAGAGSYRVRLYAADGTLLFERETADTAVSVAADSLVLPARAARIYWQLQALDRLRQPMARSPLTATGVPGSR